MKSYLVSAYWRGALNVSQMRVFRKIEEAWAYWDEVGEGSSFKRIYEVSDNGEPVLLKEKDRPE